ncbi:MAG: DUF3604 domain-containing protein [bacterium]
MAFAVSACGDSNSKPATTQTATAAGPWQRTEDREPCDAFDALRQPFFGDLHVHTRYSADASIYGTKAGPRDAYDFARGGEIAVSDADEQPTRHARLARPLDFAAVTDHAEFFGEVDLCTRPDSPVYDIHLCSILRQFEPPERQFGTIVQWLFPAGVDNPPPSLSFCTTPGVDCDAAAVSVWHEMQAAAEGAYDRTSACTFTSFIGYEHTPSRGGRHLHRNVIFRNDRVTPFAYSQLETARDGVPQGLWKAIEDNCLNTGNGCDALIIPHNSNLSDGLQFFDPVDRAEAQRRQDREPLVEIYQSKGGSECRFDRLAGRGVGTTDELCTFEQIRSASEVPGQQAPSIDVYPRRNLVRVTLEDGLGFEATLGVNPFRFGFIGGTDTHNATAGNTEERGFVGIGGNNDATPERQIRDNLSGNAGGLAGVWAEENSRDAIFAALRRRETFATSGSRPVVRFFAGSLDGVRCGAADFVDRAYQTGTPMGGELGAVRADGSPRFAVWALKDPGTASAPGTDLQRIQIVKGWLDADGAVHEQTFDVAGDADNGADVDPATCAPRGRGAAELCTVWEDPAFDSTQRAFYYARVLENPSCRWSTYVCQTAGVDPFAADCATQAAAADPAFADCCLTQTNDAFLSPTVQERAWSSPIWYRPEAVSGVRGGIRFGARPGTDSVDLTLQLAGLAAGTDLTRDAVTLELSDNDTILHTALPAGAVSLGSDGSAEIRYAARGLDLSAAERVDHTVVTRLNIGDFRTEFTRRWLADKHGLAPAPQ